MFLKRGVHSSETAQLIQTLLTNATPTRDTGAEDGEKADESDGEEEIPALAWQPEDMRALLQRSQAGDACDAASANRVRLRGKSSHKQALTIVESMWGRADACPASSSKTRRRAEAHQRSSGACGSAKQEDG